MSFSKIDLTNDDWTLIGDNVTSITFQNASQWSFYVNFNTSNTSPNTAIGLIYSAGQGELKKTVTALTYQTTPNYVFARAVSSTARIIVETS